MAKAKVKQKKTALYDRITYALYYADELQEIGTINQLAEVTGISPKRIARLKLPSYMKRRDNLDYEKQKFLIKC